MLIDQPNRKQRYDAAAGDAEALTGLVRDHGRDVRLVLALSLDRWSAIEAVEVLVWARIRQDVAATDDLPGLLRTTTRAAAMTYLDQADREAIQQRDALRHLIVQSALDDLRQPAAATPPFAIIRERLAALPAEQRSLLDLTYARGVDLPHLAQERKTTLVDLAQERCAARAACDWRTGIPVAVGDRLLPSLTEELLSNTIDPESRALLATSIAQDLGRSVRLERQIRLHLILQAMLGPFTPAQMQALVTTVLGGNPTPHPIASSTSASGRNRLRNSDAVRSSGSHRRPSGSSPAAAPTPLLLAGGGGLVLVVVGVLMFTGGRPAPTSTPSIAEPTPKTTTEVERVVTTTPPTATTSPTPGASALRPQQLAVPSVVPPLPEAPPVTTAEPVATDQTAPSVGPDEVTLINADTDQPIPGFERLARETSIRLSQLPTRRINFEIKQPPEIKSVRISLPGCSLRSNGIEKGRPFSLLNDGTDFKPWTPPVGSYTLTVRACSDSNGTKVVRTSTWILHVLE